MCKYWWQSSSTGNRGNHWKSWSKLTVHKSKGGMGFRSVRDFNLCLLSKQGWHLQNHPDSLVGRVFKARYFKSTDFINAELGNSPSFIWRSVFEAQQGVKIGVRRRVGRGTEIDILKDPWLPCDVNPKVTSVHPNLVGEKVSSLMVADELSWDVDLVRDMFNQRDADLILSITLNVSRTNDGWYWSLEKSGQFSVKSLYRHMQEMKDEGANREVSGFWKKMWKLRVPPKIKNMLWRAVSNCLPTKSLLRSKHVNVNQICPLCQVDRETTVHCLVNCSFARVCWSHMDIEITMENEVCFGTWLEERLNAAEGDRKKDTVMICWAIRTVRIDQVWKNKGATVATVVFLAKTTLQNWTKAQDRNVVPVAAFLTEADGSERWIRPVGTSIKVNVDAALFTESGNYSYACGSRQRWSSLGGNC